MEEPVYKVVEVMPEFPGGMKALMDFIQKNIRCLLYTSGEHTGKIVVHCTGKDTAKYNPQIGCRTELSSHDGT